MIRHQPGVTELLGAWQGGDSEAGHQVLALVYDELRRLAGSYVRHERVGHTLQPTALVHEACVRLLGTSPLECRSRSHLVGVAARAMRQVLVNHAHGRSARKRGRGWRRVMLDPAVTVFESRCEDLVALDEAMGRLATLDDRAAQIVELRFFGGLGMDEIAVMLDTPKRTVERDWSMARAWLRRELDA